MHTSMHDGICNFVCGRLRNMHRCVRVNSKNTHCKCNGKNRQISPRQTLKKLRKKKLNSICFLDVNMRVYYRKFDWFDFIKLKLFLKCNMKRVWCTLAAVGYIGCVLRPQTGRDFFSTRCTSQNALAWNLLAIDPFSRKKTALFYVAETEFPNLSRHFFLNTRFINW